MYISVLSRKMNQPVQYTLGNNVQRRSATELLLRFRHRFQWRLDGKDVLLDVGCASGGVLMDIMYPILPKSAQVLGLDISEDMIKYSKETYSSYKNVKFQVLDIGTEKLSMDLVDRADHVTAFYCLNWVPNQMQALKNINRMLHKGGDFFFIITVNHSLYEIYQTLLENPKWSIYMTDMNKFVSAYNFSESPYRDFTDNLTNSGFTDFQVEISDNVFHYDGLQSLLANMLPVNPFIEKIQNSLQEEYMEDYIKSWRQLGLTESLPNGDTKFIIIFKDFVEYAKK